MIDYQPLAKGEQVGSSGDMISLINRGEKRAAIGFVVSSEDGLIKLSHEALEWDNFPALSRGGGFLGLGFTRGDRTYVLNDFTEYAILTESNISPGN
jgi:hypothetical protein